MKMKIHIYFKDEKGNCDIVHAKCDKASCTDCTFATAGIVRQDINELMEILNLVERSVDSIPK
jgi:hypothetical protein